MPYDLGPFLSSRVSASALHLGLMTNFALIATDDIQHDISVGFPTAYEI